MCTVGLTAAPSSRGRGECVPGARAPCDPPTDVAVAWRCRAATRAARLGDFGKCVGCSQKQASVRVRCARQAVGACCFSIPGTFAACLLGERPAPNSAVAGARTRAVAGESPCSFLASNMHWHRAPEQLERRRPELGGTGAAPAPPATETAQRRRRGAVASTRSGLVNPRHSHCAPSRHLYCVGHSVTAPAARSRATASEAAAERRLRRPAPPCRLRACLCSAAQPARSGALSAKWIAAGLAAEQ